MSGAPSTPRPRVLVLSRNFPNSEFPTMGIWVKRLVRASAAVAEPVVVSPVPAVPPGLPDLYARYRRIPRSAADGAIPVWHPRVVAGPGYALHGWDASLAWPLLRRFVDRLHGEHPFDLIHAHFIYADGVLAARLGARYGIPVVTTEHAQWGTWMTGWPRVAEQVRRALPRVHAVTAVSQWLVDDIRAFAGSAAPVRLLPNTLDEETFTATPPGAEWDPDRILFVGVVRQVKGLDVLVRALALLAARRPSLRLTVLGHAYHRAYQRDFEAVQRLARELGCADRITYAGQAAPAEVASAMRVSALVVVPSRRETFSAVAMEALASGTPVVATRCGGPEEILTPETGRLVDREDHAALAAAIDDMLTHRAAFDGAAARASMVQRFGAAVTAERFRALYEDALRSTGAHQAA